MVPQRDQRCTDAGVLASCMQSVNLFKWLYSEYYCAHLLRTGIFHVKVAHHDTSRYPPYPVHPLYRLSVQFDSIACEWGWWQRDLVDCGAPADRL